MKYAMWIFGETKTSEFVFASRGLGEMVCARELIEKLHRICQNAQDLQEIQSVIKFNTEVVVSLWYISGKFMHNG